MTSFTHELEKEGAGQFLEALSMAVRVSKSAFLDLLNKILHALSSLMIPWD